MSELGDYPTSRGARAWRVAFVVLDCASVILVDGTKLVVGAAILMAAMKVSAGPWYALVEDIQLRWIAWTIIGAIPAYLFGLAINEGVQVAHHALTRRWRCERRRRPTGPWG